MCTRRRHTIYTVEGISERSLGFVHVFCLGGICPCILLWGMICNLNRNLTWLPSTTFFKLSSSSLLLLHCCCCIWMDGWVDGVCMGPAVTTHNLILHPFLCSFLKQCIIRLCLQSSSFATDSSWLRMSSRSDFSFVRQTLYGRKRV